MTLTADSQVTGTTGQHCVQQCLSPSDLVHRLYLLGPIDRHSDHRTVFSEEQTALKAYVGLSRNLDSGLREWLGSIQPSYSNINRAKTKTSRSKQGLNIAIAFIL